MIQKPQIPKSDIKRIFEFKNLDLRNILEEISEPSILVDLIDGRVISANYLFSDLLHMSIIEISSLRIFEIIPAIDLKKINDGEKLNVTIVLKNNQTMEARLNPRLISQTENLLLMVFEEERKENIETFNSWEEFAKAQTAFLSRFHEFSFTELVAQLIKTGKQISSCDELVLYLISENSDYLKRFSTVSTSFPDQIPVIELSRIKEIDFWEPGKRVLSEIHRAGRLNKFDSIITIPISGEGRQFGLLIAASRDSKNLNARIDLIKQFSFLVSISLASFEKFQINFNNSEKLRTKIEKLELFFNNSNDCLLLVNGKNQILEFNTNLLNLLDYLPIEILNKNLEVIFENSSLISLLNDAAQDDKKPVEVFDRHGNKKSVYSKILRFSQTNDERRIIILKDATDLMETNNSLSLLRKTSALGEILAEFAHDVRNILNRLMTGLQLLGKKINPEESTMTSIQDLQNECIGMTDLMESVLSFSRQNYKNFQSVSLKEMIERIFYRFQKMADQANTSLILSSKDSDCLAWVDPRSLERVIINLINNGIEAIGSAGGAVTANLSNSEEHPGFLLMQIADTGPGIPPEIQSSLYQKFSSGKPEGTGLGLFISQKIVEYHQGWINLETFPGGTIFDIYLPKDKRGDDQ
ncbi:MAG: ATP-binding protein [Anaerolineaceae bacterium]|nr:ATP-binding protein [Anaerolineaceae bacterium]